MVTELLYMTKPVRPPREQAARALCQMEGHPPDILVGGGPMWANYLPQVDEVVRVVLGENAWSAMVEAEKVDR